MAADQITLNRIQYLHPEVREEAKAGYLFVNEKKFGKRIRLRFAYTHRSNKLQNDIYAQGRTLPGPIVTWVKGGYSYHNYGLAFDIVILIDWNGDGIFEEASWDVIADIDKDGVSDWMEVVHHFESLGWEWGGRWNPRKRDRPHFQKTFGYSTSDLMKKMTNGEYIAQRINGELYKWPKL